MRAPVFTVMMLLETVLQDLRYGCRMLFRNSGSTMVTVFSLALGLGVNTTVFTAYQAMVNRGLDARNPTEMVNIALRRDSGGIDFAFSHPDYLAYRASVRSFNGLVAFRPARVRLSNAGDMISQRAAASATGMGRLGLLPSGASNAEFANVFAVSENYFEVLGVPPLHGRTFHSSQPSVLMSENYWQARFAGDPTILGKSVHLNGVAVTVVGITPRDFVGTGVSVPAFWIPLSMEPQMQGDEQWLRARENQRYRLFGRLAPGANIRQAQAELRSVADHLRTLHDSRADAAKPSTALVWPGSPFPLPLKQYRGLILSVLLLVAAALTVLAVACANVGSLQLARARVRQKELSTRLSLGASRIRVIRQLVTENIILGLIAGIVALFFTWAFLKTAVNIAVGAFPVEYGTLIFHINPNLDILVYVFVISMLAGMLSGFVPALESSRMALSEAIKAGAASPRSRRLQDLLLAAQVALSLVLMIAGSVLIRSSIHALEMDPGYDSKHVINVDLQFPEGSKYNDVRRLEFVRELRSRLATTVGVTAVTSARAPGMSRPRTAATSSQGISGALHYTAVEPSYFATLGIPLLLGHSFTAHDQSVIVSESAAKQFWPGQNPVGRTLRLGPTDERFRQPNEMAASSAVHQVIGVARDKRGAELNDADSKEIYLPLAEARIYQRSVLIRTQSSADQMMRTIDSVITSIDPVVAANTSTLEEMLRQSPLFIISSSGAAVASIVGSLGLILAVIGIYGTVSYIVILRTREIGIRMAIGAQKSDVLKVIFHESARPVITGLLAGVLLALGASYLARGLVSGIETVDGVSFAGVSLLFLMVALLASYAPARRATRVEPTVALRYE